MHHISGAPTRDYCLALAHARLAVQGYLPGPAETAVSDVDATLVDSDYQHARAWFRAFRRVGITLPIWRLHRATGKGGDMLVTHVAGDEVEARHGDDLREAPWQWQ